MKEIIYPTICFGGGLVGVFVKARFASPVPGALQKHCCVPLLVFFLLEPR